MEEVVINPEAVEVEIVGETAMVVLRPGQSITVNMNFFMYSSPGVTMNKTQSLREIKEARGRKGDSVRRVVGCSGNQFEYVGMGRPGGGPILALNPMVVCAEGLFVRDTHLLCTSGFTSIFSE